MRRGEGRTAERTLAVAAERALSRQPRATPIERRRLRGSRAAVLERRSHTAAGVAQDEDGIDCNRVRIIYLNSLGGKKITRKKIYEMRVWENGAK